MSAMSTRPNLQEQQRLATREALRSAALASFAERGFANVTVTELAQEAGVTERTFFRHFPTKEAVLFRDFAFEHRMTIFGEVSRELRDLTIKHAGGITVYSFLQGLETAAAV